MNELLAQYKTELVAGASAAILAVIMGKTLRRILLLPLKYLAARTRNKEDDVLVQEAARDLGLPEDAARPIPDDEEKK